LKSKWDGPYVAHSVSPSGAVMIVDIKGDQYVANGQWLKVFLEPDVVPIDYIDIYTMEDEPERQAYDVKLGNFFVNKFLFTFLIFIEYFSWFLVGRFHHIV
jgi:putative effector of murein hydrolase